VVFIVPNLNNCSKAKAMARMKLRPFEVLEIYLHFFTKGAIL